MTDQVAPQIMSNNQHKRKLILFVMSCIFVFFGLIYLIYWLGWSRYQEFTDDAYVAGNLVQLNPQTSGTIISINTDNTHLVNQGQLLIKLDDADASITLQRTTAELAQTVRQVRQYYENVRQALATLSLRRADLLKAQADLKRRNGLVNERAISAEEFLRYKTAAEAAQAQFNVTLSQLASSIALVENSHLYHHPLVEKAKANFKSAYLNWVRTTIYAPVTGYIAKRSAQVGQFVNANTSLMAIIPLNEIWVDANYKESQLRRIRIGQEVVLTADANDNIKYHGKVIGLSAGTGSAFALLPPQNATGNWIKIVQRLPIRIALEPTEIQKHPLRIGLSMRVTIYTRNIKGNVLAKTSDEKPIYATTIFNKQLANANKLIEDIVKANSTDIYLKGNPELLGQRHG